MRGRGSGYWQSVKKARKAVPRNAVFGFNVNLDAVRKAGRKEVGEVTRRITGKAEFGGEHAITAKHARKLAGAGEYGEIVGGQAGNMANDAAALGITGYVHSPSKSKKLMRLFRKGVMVAKAGKFVSARRGGDGSKPPIHFVLEFPGDRTILSYDPHNASMKADGEFYKAMKKGVAGVDRAVVGGFHLLSNGDVERRVVEITRKVIGWKRRNPRMRIHLEWGDFQNEGAMEATLRFFAPICDFVGMNEKELGGVSRYLKLRGNRYSRVKRLAKLFPNLLVHTAHYSFALSTDVGGDELENSLLFATVAAAYKGVNGKAGGFGELAEFAGGVKASERGMGEMEKFEKTDFGCNAAFVPSIAGNVKRTVGLGDCFAMAFALSH